MNEPNNPENLHEQNESKNSSQPIHNALSELK